jgi:uncharacterized membrane protein YphA (DoxX/SURF4 family)
VFPGGLAGSALLLFRAVFSTALMLAARAYLTPGGSVPVAWLPGLAALAAGVLLLIGFLTPIAGTAAGLGGVGVALSLLPACTPAVFDTPLSMVFAVTMLIGIILLGPGAFSIDARVFGRRRIISPPPVKRPPRTV